MNTSGVRTKIITAAAILAIGVGAGCGQTEAPGVNATPETVTDPLATPIGPMNPDAAERWFDGEGTTTLPAAPIGPMNPDAAEHWFDGETTTTSAPIGPMNPDAAEHWFDGETDDGQ